MPIWLYIKPPDRNHPQGSAVGVTRARVVHMYRVTVAQLEIGLRHHPPSLRAVTDTGTPELLHPEARSLRSTRAEIEGYGPRTESTGPGLCGLLRRGNLRT